MTETDPLPRRRGPRPRFVKVSGMRPKSFRAAVIFGFCLTLLIAAGTGSALALWSQSASMTMQVKAGTLPSPDLQCAKVPNETAVLVTWTPQRAGVTGYDVTVTRDGQTLKTSSYSAGVISEKITPPLLGVGEYPYAVTVTAKYGSWQARPTGWTTIRASVTVLGLGSLATISCS
jgi:hypothetical protein